MIEEAVAIGILGGVGLTIADKMNVLGGTNPTGKWWWERIFPQAPAAQISQQAIQVQPQLSPSQELAAARRSVIYSEQLLASVSSRYPNLAVASKYSIGQPSQPQQYTLPYQPKSYP
jgi:hypothetical protein